MSQPSSATDRRRDRRGLLAYFGLAYAITWGAILAYLATFGFDLQRIGTPEALVMFPLMLAGPPIAGLAMAAASGGRRAVSGLLRGFLRLRVSPRWYAVALLTTPAILLAVLLPLSVAVSPEFAPTFVVFGIAAGVLAGAIEEIGWTGYATPRLLRRYAPLAAGLALGLIWAAWHGLADFAGNAGTMGTGDWAVRMIVYWMVPLTAYRMLMTWAYAHHRSLALAALMHGSYTGWLATLTMEMPAATGANALVWQVPFAAALVLVVAIVALRTRQHRSALEPIPAAT